MYMTMIQSNEQMRNSIILKDDAAIVIRFKPS